MPLARPRSPITAPKRAEAFAVEPTSAQLCWRGLGPGPVTVDIDGQTIRVGGDAGSASIVVDDLAPDTDYRALVGGTNRSAVVEFRTIAPPAGRELSRVATISDLHLGGNRFGVFGTMRDRQTTPGASPSPHGASLRCALAAVSEATEWGAELLLIKGDLTHRTRPEHWDEFSTLLDAIEIPYRFIVGNHDLEPKQRSIPASQGLAQSGQIRQRFQVEDLPGVRIILADGGVYDESHGRLAELPDRILDATRSSPTPVMLTLHFHLERTPIPWFWPPGFPKAESDALLNALTETNANVFITSGHTHRNRTYGFGGIPITEVGATKDYPAVWAGYAVHEGGIRQVVRRVSEPSCFAWSEYTRRAVGGIWGLWSPGTLAQRCFSHHWD